MKLALPTLVLLLAGCGTPEPESAANAFARTSNELLAREAALNAQVENELSQTEQRLDAEASAALNSLNAAAASNAAQAAPAAAAAPGRASAQGRRH